MSWGQGRSPRLRQHATRALPRHCQHCGTTSHLELDHIRPLAEGGSDHITNLQWLCHTCHLTKTRAESRRGIARRNAARRRPRPPHPGDTLGGDTPPASRSVSRSA